MEFKFDLQRFGEDPEPVEIEIGGEYQFKWENGAKGIFAVTAERVASTGKVTIKSAVNVAEQKGTTTLKNNSSKVTYYLAVEDTVVAERHKLNWTLYEVPKDGDLVQVADTDVSPKDAKVKINLTASAQDPVDIQVEDAPIPFNITNLKGGSLIALKKGDTATTSTLGVNDTISVDMGDDPAVVYTVAAKGTKLEFVGETKDATNTTALKSGTVKLAADGDDEGFIQLPNGDEVTTSDDELVVTVSGGKVTHITGFNGTAYETTVVVKETVKGVQSTITYTVMNNDGTMVQREEGGKTTYLDLKPGGEIYSNKSSYKTAVDNIKEGTIGVVGKGEKYLYVATPDSDPEDIEDGNTRGVDEEKGTFFPKAGAYYIRVDSQTADANEKTSTPKTTTITSVKLYKSNAAGALTNITTSAYTGTISYDANGAAVNFTKKATDKYTVKITNADIRSKFTNLGAKDSVTTNDTDGTELSANTYKVYNEGTVSNTLTVKGKVTVKVDEGAISGITAMDAGDEVTITGLAGLASRKVTAGKGSSATEAKVTVVDTDKNGNVTTYKDVVVTASTLAAADITGTLVGEDKLLGDITGTQSIEADFDWTANKSQTGYFKVSSTKSGTSVKIPKSGKTEIKSTDTTATTYIKVTLGEAGAFSLSKVSMVGLQEYETPDFQGTITIDAPATAINLTYASFFDPENDTSNISGIDLKNVVWKFSNVAGGSNIGLDLGEKDEIKTAKLGEKAQITVGKVVEEGDPYAVYIAAKDTTLTIKQSGLCSGTVWAGTSDDNAAVKVGSYEIANGNAVAGAYDITEKSFTVTATSSSAFTLGALDDGDKVSITDSSGEGDPVTTTFVKYGNYLYTDGDAKKMYAITKGFKSDSLMKNTNWTTAIDLTDAEAKTGKTIVDLALADKAFKANDTPAAFVRDRYVATALTDDSKVTARVVDAKELDNAEAYLWKHGEEDPVGEGTIGVAAHDLSHAYTALSAQTITVTNGWEVSAAADADTTITGAASGEDYLAANTGNDTITLGGAVDTVDETTLGGHDTITKYDSAKDKILVAETDGVLDVKFTLGTTADDVYIYEGDADYAAASGFTDDKDYALLKGVGGKGFVKINDKKYYFGKGTEKSGKASAETFTYDAEGIYYGNKSGDNTLKIVTDKSKNSKTVTDAGNVSVDLSDPDTFHNIKTADASASANVVELTASEDGSILKGGTYRSKLTAGTGADTLVGGSGNDNFVLGAVTGADTIQKYDSSKDVISTELDELTADNFEADAKGNVLLKNGETGTVTIEGAVTKAIKVDASTVYVGKQETANTFTVNAAPGESDIYVGSSKDDTIVLSEVVSKITATTDTDDGAAVSFTANKYQGGTMKLSGDNYKSIEVVNASGVKAAAALVSEYGTKFVKAVAGVNVTASNDGTTFIGSAFDDKFTCGDGADTFKCSTNQGADIVADFGVGDVIQLNNLNNDDIAKLNAYTDAGLTEAAAVGLSFSAGGSIKVTAEDATLHYDKDTKQITAVGNN